MKPIVVIGSGHAGVTLIRELRLINKEIPIILITQDDGCSYYKPNLSKAISMGKSASDLVMKKAEQIKKEQDIFFKTHTQVTSIDTENNCITVDDAGSIERILYKDLIITTGASPIELPITGNAKNDVISVNTLEDYRKFRESIDSQKQVLIIGAGFVGVEFVSDLFASDYHVDVVDMEEWPLKKALPQMLGQSIVESFPNDKVNWHFGSAVVSVDNNNESLKVTLSCGKILQVDVVLSAVGIKPNIDLAKAASVSVNRGIVVDNFLRTSVENIYAIGDCAEISGHVLPFIAPATFAAKALAKTLLVSDTKLNIPSLAVAVKIPTCATVVCPSLSLDGNWKVEGESPDFVARFINNQGEVSGFALTGKSVSQKASLLKECIVPF
jgi:rubredoxin-NAD+ reductase|tara:strand:+ start:2268 stop:3419 length:1152 start_codon:yes stop_codon:yes gene_type:complete